MNDRPVFPPSFQKTPLLEILEILPPSTAISSCHLSFTLIPPSLPLSQRNIRPLASSRAKAVLVIDVVAIFLDLGASSIQNEGSD